MNRILCSLGAIIGRPNGRDITLLNKCLERLECDGYEFMMYDTWYEKLGEIENFMLDFPAVVPVFHCENVVCNHFDPMSHMTSLARIYPDIQFTYDTKMAEFHRQIDLLYEEENRWLFKHIRHMHINDFKGGYMDWKNLKTLHIGNGQVDFEKLFNFIKSVGYSGDFTVEATSFDSSGEIDFDALNSSFRKIRAYMG